MAFLTYICYLELLSTQKDGNNRAKINKFISNATGFSFWGAPCNMIYLKAFLLSTSFICASALGTRTEEQLTLFF